MRKGPGPTERNIRPRLFIFSILFGYVNRTARKFVLETGHFRYYIVTSKLLGHGGNANEIYSPQGGQKHCFATCDLRWDDLDLPKRTIAIRRLKGSTDSVHYLERDELAGLKALQRHYAKQGVKSAWVFVNEREEPFGRMGIARVVERAGEAAKLPFPVHVHMLRHSTGYALANRGMDTRRLQHFLGHASITNTVRYTAMSPEPFKDIWR